MRGIAEFSLKMKTMPHFLSSGRKNKPWLCLAWAPQFQPGGNWSLAKLTAAPGLGFLSPLHISHSNHPFSSLVPTFKHLKEKVLNFLTFFTSRLRGGEGLEIAVCHKNNPWPSNSFNSTNYFFFFFLPWNDQFYPANCFRMLIFQKSSE